MRYKAKILFLIALAAVFSGCEKNSAKRYNPEKEMVMLYYAAAYNNLSSNIKGNLNVLKSANMPFYGSKHRILTFTHFSKTDSDYTTKTESHLVMLSKDFGKLRCDTLYAVSQDRFATDPAVLREVLLKVQELFPGAAYGLVFSSHGTGWLPVGKYNSSNFIEFALGNKKHSGTGPLYRYNEDEGSPKVKSFGAEVDKIGGVNYSREMTIQDMAAAIPMHLDYILFDACLMGGIEVAYELKDVADKVAFSPTEVLARGFDYSDLSSLVSDHPCVEDFCKAYFDYSNACQGTEQSATISVVGTSGLAGLADPSRALFSKYRSQIAALGTRSGIQKYYRGDKHWFFDFEDILVKAGISDEDKSALESALGSCVSYKAATPAFLGIEINNYSGLSMYLPSAGDAQLNTFYKTLSWNKDTNLVE